MQLENELKSTIEEAYELFSKYTITKTLQICRGHCVSEEDEKELVNTPLRDVSRDLLDKAYYESARNYSDRELWEMKHFLPRVLELMSNYEFPTHSIEITLTRLDFNQAEKWEDDEIELLNRFSKVYFQFFLETPPFKKMCDGADSLLIMFGSAFFDIKPLLLIWEDANNMTSLIYLKDLICHGMNFKRFKYKLSNPFATDEISEIVTDWVNSKRVREKFSAQIEHIIMQDNIETDVLNELSLLYEILNNRVE